MKATQNVYDTNKHRPTSFDVQPDMRLPDEPMVALRSRTEVSDNRENGSYDAVNQMPVSDADTFKQRSSWFFMHKCFPEF